jgi:hypothetical protein
VCGAENKSNHLRQIDQVPTGGEGARESRSRPSGLASKYRNKSAQALRFKSVDWCENHEAALVVWPSDQPSERVHIPFRCRSWRHTGECQRWQGAQDFVRCRDAILSRGPQWVYVVLTLAHRAFRDEWAAYRSGVHLWGDLCQRLTRRYGRIEYIQTWEKHVRSDFPHVNLVIHNERIWRLCEGEGWRSWRRDLKVQAVAVGFGVIVYAEPLRAGGSLTLAGYLTKLSRELTGASIKNQVPVNAPRHFRRIRASRGLLPARFKKDGWTGFLNHP